jgi:hypothetical protein
MPVDINTCATPTSSKYKNTSLEVINDVYGGATSPVFPSVIKGSIHIVQYTDALIFYVKGTDGVWVGTIQLSATAPSPTPSPTPSITPTISATPSITPSISVTTTPTPTPTPSGV